MKARDATGQLGYWFGFGLCAMLSLAGLSAVGLVLFAAVRGLGRWLGAW